MTSLTYPFSFVSDTPHLPFAPMSPMPLHPAQDCDRVSPASKRESVHPTCPPLTLYQPIPDERL